MENDGASGEASRASEEEGQRRVRIVRSCAQNDFLAVDHLASITEHPEQLDISTLSRSQYAALHFLCLALPKGISWPFIKKVVREVLFWGESDESITKVSIRFLPDLNKELAIKKFVELWGSGEVQRIKIRR